MRQARVIKRITSATLMTAASAALYGCDIPSFIDPSEMYAYTKKTIQKPILTSLSSIDPSVDDPDVTFFNATDINPAIDNKVLAEDYKIGVGDMVSISVEDLVGLGAETTKQARVSESGNISMPLIGQVKAVGLTEDQLQTAIADAYKNGQIISNARVTVNVLEARARTFSALGALGQPGQYQIPQADFRMLDAMVLFRDVTPQVDSIYIIRQLKEDPTPEGDGPTAGANAARGSAGSACPPAPQDPLAPKGDVLGNVNHAVMLQATDPLAGGNGSTAGANGSFQFNSPSGIPETRTIRVPIDALKDGDLKYNIVIRPKDLIIAPPPPFGNIYLSGHVARPGVYSVPPAGITVKQAVVSAGMLDGVAIPQRTELIRRVAQNREVFVAIDTNAIFSGAEPDIFLKNNDMLHVGTNILAPFIAAVRGGFRITYGFGFLYDRNFYTGNSGNGGGGF